MFPGTNAERRCQSCMKSTTILVVFAVLVGCFSNFPVFGQKTHKARSTIAKRQNTIISGGVVNGKAVNLAVPIYPEAASAIGLYGQVVVQVMIEIDGTVVTANAVSGHPLLKTASVNAALRSIFETLSIGGNPVRVSGFIHYNFQPKRWNWLELGFSLKTTHSSFYLRATAKNYFPPGFVDEETLLSQEIQDTAVLNETIIASVKNKLINESKSRWLFSVGLILGEMRRNWNGNERELREGAAELELRLLSKPENVSKDLMKRLEHLAIMIKNSASLESGESKPFPFNKILNEIEQRFPMYGN